MTSGILLPTPRLLLDLIERFDVKASGPEMPVEFLSGGNQQKLVLGRALSGDPKLLIASRRTGRPSGR